MGRVRKRGPGRIPGCSDLAFAVFAEEPLPAGHDPFEALTLRQVATDPDPPTWKPYSTAVAAWTAGRQDILHVWTRKHPGTRPPVWWTRDAPEPRPEGEAEAEYLDRHGLLTDAEREALDRDPSQPAA